MAILTTNGVPVGAGSELIESSWQQQIKAAIRDLDQLCIELKLPQKFRAKIKAVNQFPVFVPPAYLSRIRPADPRDPLLLQVLPVIDEDTSPADFVLDPLAESASNTQPGILHKYAGRVLLVTTGVCAIHCRYCFRRHFPYEQSPNSTDTWRPAIDQISADGSIEEVLLSGGDPLTLVDANLRRLIQNLDSIPHLQRLRIHTRLPIVVPQRVTDELLDTLTSTRLQLIVVVHINHVQEIDQHVESSLARLAKSGILLFNQSVLLRGVNDNAEALIQLSKRLIECQVVPYYLHQLDKVFGAAHFEVSIERGKQLIAELRAALPGYAVPRYVREFPGQASKTVLA